MNKSLLLLPLLLAACAGQTTTVSPEVILASYHSRPTTPAGHPYNQFNPGGGVHITQQAGEIRYGVRVADYDNSINQNSLLTVGTVEYCKGEEWHGCAGVMAGNVTGYNKAITPMAAPTLEFGYGRVSVDLTTFPTSDFKAEVFTGWISVRAFEFDL